MLKHQPTKFFKPVLLLTSAFVSASVFNLSVISAQEAKPASDVGIEAQEALITKFTQVYLRLSPADASRSAVTLRLADLHAEKARRLFQKEMNGGCTDCQSGRSDREKAIRYYQEAMEKIPAESQGKILIQVGHLYELNSQESKAQDTYAGILSGKHAEAVKSEASLSLGEIAFKRRDFGQARNHFEAVIKNQVSPQKGLASYRYAWCDFNLGKVEEAITGLEKILTDPSLLHRNVETGSSSIDKQFQEEVSRDLATFYAKRTMQPNDAAKIYELSPESAKIANVTYLASEVERLGQLPQALQVWKFVREKQSNPEERLESQVHVATLHMQTQDKKAAAQEFDRSLSLWSQIGQCRVPDTCKELKTRLKNFVVDWNKLEKKAPSPELLEAYQKYIQVFPDAADMKVWAGQIAKDLKQYPLSIELYLSSASEAQYLESSLLTAIEIAEISKDNSSLEKTYQAYLKQSKERKKEVEVKYQLARLSYEAKAYDKASESLREIALLPGAQSIDIKKQAADLALDSLAIMKDDSRILNWAKDFSTKYPDKAKEYMAVARKAILNQAAGLAAAPEKAWTVLASFDAADSETSEKASFYKNRLILAEKLKKFPEAREASEQLLKIPGISEEDKNYALSRKAWLSELVLDFDSALEATQKLPTVASEKPAVLLKLAMYADLAAKDSSQFYQEYLKLSTDEERKISIATILVNESKEPVKEFAKQKNILIKQPATYTDMGLKIFLKSKNPEIAKEMTKTPELAKTEAGKVFQRMAILEDYHKQKANLEKHRIDSANQKKLATTLKARIALLEQAEKLAGKAVDSGDWTAQLMTLDLFAKQSERFYQEILGLPVPVGLTPEQEQEYLNELSKQASPHLTKANDVKKKLAEFWSNTKAFENLNQQMAKTSEPLRQILVDEAEALKSIAPEDVKSQFTSRTVAATENVEKPNLQTLESARQAVRDNPLDRVSLTNLMNVEKQMGRPKMVMYLEGRLQSMDKREDKQ